MSNASLFDIKTILLNIQICPTKTAEKPFHEAKQGYLSWHKVH